MDFHSDDITVPFLTCTSCDFVWRAFESENCSHCEGKMGAPLALEQYHKESLLHLIDVMPIDDMDNFMGIMQMIDARYMQAYWMYLRTLEHDENVQHLMDVFHGAFTQTVEDVVPPLECMVKDVVQPLERVC